MSSTKTPAIPPADIVCNRRPHVYSYFDRPVSTPVDTGTESLTQQQFEAETNILSIIRNMGVGLPPEVQPNPIFADCVAVPGDFREAMQMVEDAKDSFMTLPADLRTMFEDNPANLVAFLANPDNQERAYELGLAVRPDPVPTPEPTPEPGTQTPDQGT